MRNKKDFRNIMGSVYVLIMTVICILPMAVLFIFATEDKDFTLFDQTTALGETMAFSTIGMFILLITLFSIGSIYRLLLEI